FKANLLNATPESIFYRIAGELLSPIFNLNELKAQLSIANAHQEQAFLEYQKVSLKAYLEVSTQLWNLENLKNQLALQKDQVTALEEANRISTVLFKAARADYLEVLLTQRESLEAQNQWLDSQKQLINANIALYKAVGGGWF
ncbi:MAG: TolC family protein, partial [Flavobacteriaceae bacterium]